MNVYHITYAPGPASLCLHFWGCNLNCRACLLKKEIYDCHLEETRRTIFDDTRELPQPPQRFLSREEVRQLLDGLKVTQVIFMGAEATLDPELPGLAKALHEQFHSYNILLTNGLRLPCFKDVDEVVLSIKAYSDSLHCHYTGKSNASILHNFAAISQQGVRLRAESVFIPEYIDWPEIERIARFIAGVDRDIPYRIDAYLPVADNPWRRPSPQEMEQAVDVARRYLSNVSCLKGNESLKYEVMRVY